MAAMTDIELWTAYIRENPSYKDAPHESWCYGGDNPDALVRLTVEGIKRATASAYPFYEQEKCGLPQPGDHSIILKTDGSAVCIIRDTAVTVVPFSRVSSGHARLEGEGDGSLRYWREVHAKFFAEELEEIGGNFSEAMLVVCEEFEVVFIA